MLPPEVTVCADSTPLIPTPLRVCREPAGDDHVKSEIGLGFATKCSHGSMDDENGQSENGEVSTDANDDLVAELHRLRQENQSLVATQHRLEHLESVCQTISSENARLKQRENERSWEIKSLKSSLRRLRKKVSTKLCPIPCEAKSSSTGAKRGLYDVDEGRSNLLSEGTSMRNHRSRRGSLSPRSSLRGSRRSGATEQIRNLMRLSRVDCSPDRPQGIDTCSLGSAVDTLASLGTNNLPPSPISRIDTVESVSSSMRPQGLPSEAYTESTRGGTEITDRKWSVDPVFEYEGSMLSLNSFASEQNPTITSSMVANTSQRRSRDMSLRSVPPRSLEELSLSLKSYQGSLRCFGPSSPGVATLTSRVASSSSVQSRSREGSCSREWKSQSCSRSSSVLSDAQSPKTSNDKAPDINSPTSFNQPPVYRYHSSMYSVANLSPVNNAFRESDDEEAFTFEANITITDELCHDSMRNNCSEARMSPRTITSPLGLLRAEEDSLKCSFDDDMDALSLISFTQSNVSRRTSGGNCNVSRRTSGGNWSPGFSRRSSRFSGRESPQIDHNIEIEESNRRSS